MRPLAFTIGICWIVFWLYWIVSAFSSKKGTAPTSAIKQFIGIRVVILGLAAIMARSFNSLPVSLQTHLFGKDRIVLALGLVLFLAGFALAIWARVYLGKNWGMPMTRKQDPELVTSGPYRYVRHPIYTGLLSMIFGSAIDVNTYWLIVFIAAALYFIYSAIAEEKLMTKQFPKVYPAYKAKTKMLIPLVF